MDRVLIILFIFLILIIMYIDINKKYIPNFLNFFLLIIVIFFKFENLEELFIGAGIYTLPIIILYGYGSDIMNKEIIGFGDVKLIISLGAILYSSNINIFLQVYIFYLSTFLIASLFILLLFVCTLFNGEKINFKNRELAFAPFIIIAFVLNFYFLNERGLLCLNELLAISKL